MKSNLTKLLSRSKPLPWLLLMGSLGVCHQAVAQYSDCGAVDPSGSPAKPGLYAEYYAGYFNDAPSFFRASTPGLVRTEAQVNFASANTWGNIVPPASGSATAPTNFSVRLRGEIYLPTAGSYIFYTTSDDASYLWVDGEAGQLTPNPGTATVDNGGEHTAQTRSRTMTNLTAGWHNLQLLYGDKANGSGSVLTFEYSGPGIVQQVVPSSALCTGSRLAPTTLSYTLGVQQVPYQTAATSGIPVVASRNSPITNYSLANASNLPAGITIDPATGVLTAAATVLPGTYQVDVAATNGIGTTTFAGVYTFVVNAACGGIDPYGKPAQPGLQAEYYQGYFDDQLDYFTNNTAFPLGSSNNSARIQRVENAPNYTNDGAWEDSGLKLVTAGLAQTADSLPSKFTARYRGKIYISTAGVYTFFLDSDDGSFLAIDGSATAQVLAAPYAVNNGGGHPRRTESGTVNLTVGWHSLVLIYGNSDGTSYLSLQYAGPDGSGITRQVIPSSVLCTGIESVPTGVAYAARSQSYAVGSVASSGLPTVYSANSTPVTYAIANVGSLPTGITIDAATGVLTADATLAIGSYAVGLALTNAYGTAIFPDVYTFNVLVPGCTGNDMGGNAAQPGLYGEYFAGYFGTVAGPDSDNELAFFATNTPKIKAVAPILNFTTNDSWSKAGIQLATAGAASNSDTAPTLFSARFRGRIYIGVEGIYTFFLRSDDASYLFLDEAAEATKPTVASATVNNGSLHDSTSTRSGTKFMTVGLHDIQILYGQNPTDTYLSLQYTGPDGSGITRQVVPSNVLCSSSTLQPLPVVLTRFGAQALGAVVAVNWATASEQRSASFEVERSSDGSTFTKIGQVAAAGTTSQVHQYQLLDRAPLGGLSYYRLRQVDLDGTMHYSSVVAVQAVGPVAAPLLTLAPNPTTGRVVVQLVQAIAQPATLQVLDVLGRTVYQQGLAAAATQEQTLELQALPAGVYLVRVTSATGVVTQRLVRN